MKKKSNDPFGTLTSPNINAAHFFDRASTHDQLVEQVTAEYPDIKLTPEERTGVAKVILARRALRKMPALAKHRTPAEKQTEAELRANMVERRKSLVLSWARIRPIRR